MSRPAARPRRSRSRRGAGQRPPRPPRWAPLAGANPCRLWWWRAFLAFQPGKPLPASPALATVACMLTSSLSLHLPALCLCSAPRLRRPASAPLPSPSCRWPWSASRVSETQFCLLCSDSDCAHLLPQPCPALTCLLLGRLPACLVSPDGPGCPALCLTALPCAQRLPQTTLGQWRQWQLWTRRLRRWRSSLSCSQPSCRRVPTAAAAHPTSRPATATRWGATAAAGWRMGRTLHKNK